MGSLPNLDHGETMAVGRREREKERVMARERAREREFCQDLDSLRERALTLQVRHNHNQRQFVQRRVIRTRSAGNTHHLTEEPLEILKATRICRTQARGPSSTNATSQHGCYQPSFVAVDYSATATATNSSSNPHPNAAYLHGLYHHHHNIIQPQNVCGTANRRRESANSSTASVKRLLIIKNRGCRHKIPVHIRAKVIRNFILLAIGHLLASATLLPLMGLQSSNSLWSTARKVSMIVMDTPHSLSTTSPRDILVGGFGSLMLSLALLLTSGMCFLTRTAIRLVGHHGVILGGYIGVGLFLVLHFLPTLYTLIPAYIILGVIFGPTCITKLDLLIVTANQLSCGQHECCNALSTPTTNPNVDSDDPIVFASKSSACSRDENIRRLARWFHAAQDVGIILGSLVASVLLTCSAFGTPNSLACGRNESSMSLHDENAIYNSTASSGIAAAEVPSNFGMILMLDHPLIQKFDVNSHGQRICGAASCPAWMHTSYVNVREERTQSGVMTNGSETNGEVIFPGSSQLPSNSRIQATTMVYLIFSLISICTIAIGKFSDKIMGQPHYRVHSNSGLTDTLIFASPMVFFIGTEQGYILGDFMKAYVSCSIGPHSVGGALVGMGIMQLIASCTLSMLLRYTKRIVVIIAGFFFHACLLLVLSRWKPSADDSELFYVIPAAWGVCNAVWETLIFAMMSMTHKNHMLDVLSPVYAIKYLAMGITFGAHDFLCEYAKIIVLAILLVVSVPPYASLELRLEAQRKAMHANRPVLQIPTL